MTNTTELPEAKQWRKRIHEMIQMAHANMTAKQAELTAYSINYSMCDALAVKGPEVAEAQGAWDFYAKIQETLEQGDEARATEATIAQEIVSLIDLLRSEALRTARNGFHSTSPFHNAVDAAKLSGYIAALEGHYGAGGPRILRHLRDWGGLV